MCADAWPAETLLSACQDALTNDHQWRSAIHAREASYEKLPQARAGLLPEISLSGNTRWNETRYSTISPYTQIKESAFNFNSNEFRVTLTQPIFHWDSIVTSQQADYDLLAADKQLEKDFQDLLLRVAQVYTELASATEMLEAANNQVFALEEQYQITQKSYQLGVGNITELRESEARLQIGKADVMAARRDINLKRAAFRGVVGREDRGVKLLGAETSFVPPYPNSLNAWVENATANSPDILRKAATLEKARLEISKRKAGHYPVIDAVISRSRGAAEHTAAALEGFVDRETVYGLEVKIPIFSGFSVNSKVREAVANKDKLEEDVEYAREIVRKDTVEAFGKVSDGLSEYEMYQSALDSSEKSVAANRLGYKVGVRSNIDILNAQQQVFSTVRRVISNKYEIVYYSLKLKALVGDLTEEYLREMDSLLK